MAEITSKSETPGRKRFPYRIRLEPRLQEPPRWYPFLVSLGAIVIALILGGILISVAGGDPLRSYAHIAEASFGAAFQEPLMVFTETYP